MPNYTVDPITGIKIPTVGVDPGPDYADNISEALGKLAHLTHTGASNSDGYQIPSAGINFNADLSAQSNNLTALRSTRFSNNVSVLAGIGDIDCVYVKGNDLWYNNGSGTPVQITSGVSLNSSASNNYTTVTTAVNLTINAGDATIQVSVTGGTPVITLPLIADVPTGRFYIIKDSSGTSTNITINPAGGNTFDNATTSYHLRESFGGVLLVSNGTKWQIYPFSFQMNNNVFLTGRNAGDSAYQNLIGVDTNNQTSISQSTAFTRLHGGLRIENKPVSTATYFVDTTTKDIVLYCDTSGTAIQVNLPAAEYDARVLIIKDVGGNAATNNITITPYTGGAIEGLVADKIIQSNYGSVTLVSDSSGDWWMV